MANKSNLSDGHNSASVLDEGGLDTDSPVSATLESYYLKNEALRGVPAPIIRKAWFTMAHLMVMPGATIVDMGCSPKMTYAMAVLNPQINFIGIDSSKKIISTAQKNFVASNLEFRTGDIKTMAGLEAGSVDALISSFILHEIFSNLKHSERALINSLDNHFNLLKQNGLMFIRDYAMPPPEEYVLLEMRDFESASEALEDLSEPDLLVWYAEHARPRGNKKFTGFFLEELPPRFPQTRLFRLPYKWAYEFIMRKDDRATWHEELAMEYTFFTPREFRKNLRGLGARVLYTSPQWDDAIIKERFEGNFHIYADDGKPLPLPATSFVAVAQKVGDNKSLRLQERRPSNSMDSQIRITAMRNDTNGQIFDIITRNIDITEILPYRVTETGDLNIFVHEGLPRGIANAVPRSGKQLDGKRWSGHMTEAISLPSGAIHDVEQGEPKAVVLFARDYLGLKPAMGCTLEKGPNFFPAPDFIDEQIKTRFLRVSEHEGTIIPKYIPPELEGFTTNGLIREINAQSILNAINVGFLPNSRLEMQILHLYDLLGMKAETWNECPLALESGLPKKNLDTKKFLRDRIEADKRFKNIKGTAGNLRTIKSIFIDEGWIEGGLEGMASRDMEFVISDDQTINKAVILPLTKHSQTGLVMGGVVTEYLPIPQRHSGNGLTIRAPSITLPKEVTSLSQAKRFIATQFDIPPEKVARLGESYFCHLGLTPIRIFPFCVATTGESSGPLGGPVQYAPLMKLINLMWAIDDFGNDRYIVSRFQRVYRSLAHSSEVSGDWSMNANQIYEQTINAAPAVMNSTNTTGLGFSGWSAQKSRKKIEEAAALARSTYISTPDFVDIHHAVEKGFVPSGKSVRGKDVDHDVKNRKDTKSTGT